MKNSRVKLSEQDEVLGEHLLVADIVRYLSGLAKLHEDNATGNPALSEGMRQVAKALRPYANCPVLDLAGLIKNNSAVAKTRPARKSKGSAFTLELDSNLESVGQSEVERILNDDASTKKQIAELGFRRFGISRSKLERLNLEDARYSVRTALENEKALDVISEVARKSGKVRSS